MTTMLERVARAIRDEDGAYQHSDGAWMTEGGIVGDDHWIGIARAAIEAMREPTIEILQAMAGRALIADCGTLEGARDIYSNFHHAALSPTNEPLAEGVL